MGLLRRVARPTIKPVSPEPFNEVCDICYSARASVRVTTKNGGRLYFCGHHADENMLGFLRDGAQVEDKSFPVS